MTKLNESLAWAVLAPLTIDTLEQIIANEWKREFPHAVDLPPWEVVAGNGVYMGIVSHIPGTEGSDWHFAEIASRFAGEQLVYSLWFDPEHAQIIPWRNSARSAPLSDDPLEFLESLMFSVEKPHTPERGLSLAAVEGASVDDIRHTLGEIADESWLHIAPNRLGVIVTADDGMIGTQAWDIAEQLPDVTVYYVQFWAKQDRFRVQVINGTQEIGAFGSPAFPDEQLSDIKGEKTPQAILRALDIPFKEVGLEI